MSMITRCPECETLFKVVPDQLRISDGWVRCGQCGQVFDGAAHLQQSGDAETVAPQPLSTTEHLVVEGDEAPLAAPQQLAEEDAAAVVVDDQPASIDGPVGETEHPDVDLSASGGTVPDALAATSVDSEPSSSNDEVSFLRAARRGLFWQRPVVRWGLALCATALTFALALQVAVHERDWLAGTVPATRPGLQAMCEVLGCRVLPLKRIEMLTVESSSFNRVRGDTYRLQVTLKNTGHTELHWPAVELTLTDTRDEAVLRRVLSPADLGVTTTSLPAAAEWSGSLMVNLSGVSRISGYRVLAFYP